MKMLVTAVAAMILGAAAPGLAAPSGFTFTAPPGWVDLSSGSPVSKDISVPPALLEQAKSGAFAFYAADVAQPNDGFIENVNAVVTTQVQPPRLTLSAIDEIEKEARDGLTKRGMSYRVLKKDIIPLGGVPMARIVAEIDGAGTQVKMIQYVITGHKAYATLTFSTTPAAFDRYEATFDTAAQATRGAVAPNDGELSGWLIGVIAGVGGSLGAAFAIKKKANKKADAAKP